MRDIQDSFGQLLLAQYRTTDKEVYEIIERDDGYIDAARRGRYLADFKAWTESERTAMKYVSGRVLDIGCGPGRVAIYLQNNGYDVTGMDISNGALTVSKMRGLRKRKLLSIDQIGEFKPDSFDTLIMFGNNFGLFGSPKKAKRILAKMRKITSDDGRIIAQCCDPYKTKDTVHLDYQKANRERGRMSGQLRLRVRFKNIIGPWFDYLFVSLKEMKAMLAGTGWQLSEVIEDDSPVYIVIIRKIPQVHREDGAK